MSFDVNIGRSEPVIKPASNMNNDGGSGGNTGYMGGGRRNNKENQGSLFSKNDNSSDTFVYESKISSSNPFEVPEEKSWLKSLLNKINK